MKRIISILLISVMLMTAAPLSAFAETPDENAKTADPDIQMSYEATNAFGTRLKAAAEQSDTGELSDYAVCGVDIAEGKASVSFRNAGACTLIVAVYDDSGETMLDYGYADITETDAETAEVSLDAELPEYYTVRAFLTPDHNDLTALCPKYEDIKHTSAYAEFESKTVEDFDADLVYNLDDAADNNFAVYKEGTIRKTDDGRHNIITSFDSENEVYELDKIDEDVRGLKPGDVFEYSQGDYDIIAVIKAVEINGDKAVITGDTSAGLGDFYDYIKIGTEATLDADAYDGDDDSELPEGVTYEILDENDQPVRRQSLAQSLRPTLGESKVTIGGKKIKNTIKLGEKKKLVDTDYLKINGTVEGTVEVTPQGSISLALFEDGEIYDVNIKLGIHAEEYLSFSGKVDVFIPLKGIKIDTGLDILKAGCSCNLHVSFAITFKVGFSQDFMLDFGISASRGFYNDSLKPVSEIVDFDAGAEVSVSVGLQIKADAKVKKKRGKTMWWCEASAEAGVKAKGTIFDLDDVGVMVDPDVRHDCGLCIDGSFSLYFKIEYKYTKLKNSKITHTKTPVDLSFKLCDFYLSVKHKEFGINRDCPHILYRIGITVVDENNKAVSGAEITYFDENGKLQNLSTDSAGKLQLYLSDGLHTINAKKNGVSSSKDVTVNGTTTDLTIVIRQSFTVFIYVKDSAGNQVDGADIVVTRPDGNSVAQFSSSDKKSYVSLPVGDYTASAEKDGKNAQISFTVDGAKNLTINIDSGPDSEPLDKDDDPIKASDLKTGDLVTFGSYPQTEVKDSATLSALNGRSLTWKSYDYYSGDDSSGSMAPSDYMKYADVTYNGNKYRAVKFTYYRPCWTVAPCSADNSCQDENGYVTDKVYWFKFEPIVWRVLDSGKGLLMTEKLIDSQAFENDDYYNGDYFYGDKNYEHYASNWAYSSLREWLNGDFYKTAFASSAEKGCVRTTSLTTPSSYDSEYDADPTKDKVFLLTRDDVTNTGYGFSSDSGRGADTNRVAFGTDYAKCQGLDVNSSTGYYYSGASYWRLRTPGNSLSTGFVSDDGYVNDRCSTDITGYGVRAALNINLQSAISQSLIKKAGSAVTPTQLSLSGTAALTPARTAAPVARRTVGVGASPAAKTASHDKCVPGNEYVFVCVKDPDSDIFADGNLLYIDQKTAEGDTVEFTYSAEAGTELFFGEFTGDAPSDDYVPGDVNGDGDVLANDARLALRASAQLETLEGAAALAADVNEDGKILADDARQILRFSAQLVTEFVKKTD